MQLARAVAVAAVLAASTTAAHADGALSMRGVYYKEKATRVIQPMVDGRFDVGDDGEAEVHMLVDAITSASVAAGALDEPFDERRWEIGGGYRKILDDVTVGGRARLSYEPDYFSAFALGSIEAALADQMTTVGLTAGIGHDEIGRAGAGGLMEMSADVGTLTTALASLSLGQVVSKDAVLSLTYDLIYLDGYQANPYRTAITADGLTPERHPETRWRHAVATTAKRFVDATETTLIASYRFYTDTWDLDAHTPELRVIQQAGDGVDLGLRYRFHWQTAADFYLPSYPTNDPMEYPYLTDDVKLSRFTSHTVGFKVGVLGGVLGFRGRLEEARGEIVLEYLDQNNRFGNAVIAHAALTLPLEY